MKRFILGLLSVFLISCTTAGGNSGTFENVPPAAATEEARLEQLSRMGIGFLTVEIPEGSPVVSIFSNTIVPNPLPEAAQAFFGDAVFYRFDQTYLFDNRERKADFYVMFFDFPKETRDFTSVKQGSVIGERGKLKPKLTIVSKSLHPYLVVNSSSMPAYEFGYYFFYPDFLMSTAGNPDFFSFLPIADINGYLIDSARNTGNTNGDTIFGTRMRYKSSLDSYPRPLTPGETAEIAMYERVIYGRSGLYVLGIEISVGGYPYLLCWQKGFDGFLRNEYILRQPVWLYATLAAYNSQNNKGYIFVRDFRPLSVEEMYDGRIGEIKKALNK